MPTDLGGYEYNFVKDPPDSLVCKICHRPCRVPYLTGCCGHNFCKSCLDAAKRTIACCPYCRNQVEFATLPNKLSDREIKSLLMICTNKEKGCEWQGELNSINNHLRNSVGCQFEDVKCSNGCGKILQRQYLTSHIQNKCPCRRVDCHYCHKAGKRWFVEGEHKKQCPKLPLPCPNKCEVGSILREDMEAHRKECPLEMVHCSNKCLKRMPRKHLTSHIETECPRRKVNCQYCHITGEHQFIEREHKKQCPKFPLPCPNKCEIGSVPREDMEIHRKECPLEVVQCEYHNVGCEERMMRKDLEWHNKNEMEKHLSLTSSQLATALKHIDTLMIALHSTIPHQYNIRVPSASMITEAQRSVNLKTMAAMIKCDRVCPVVISVNDFNKKKANDVGWYSDFFYTHDKGYKMCLRVDPAGSDDGEGTHLSVFLYLMKGPHDDELTWPLRGKFKVKLLNQNSDCEHCSYTMSYDDCADDDIAGKVTDGDTASGWGYPEFISLEDLHEVTPTCQYLKDDCIFLQVSKF